MANGGADALLWPLDAMIQGSENVTAKGCFWSGCLLLLLILSVPIGIGIAIGYMIHG